MASPQLGPVPVGSLGFGVEQVWVVLDPALGPPGPRDLGKLCTIGEDRAHPKGWF